MAMALESMELPEYNPLLDLRPPDPPLADPNEEWPPLELLMDILPPEPEPDMTLLWLREVAMAEEEVSWGDVAGEIAALISEAEQFGNDFWCSSLWCKTSSSIIRHGLRYKTEINDLPGQSHNPVNSKH